MFCFLLVPTFFLIKFIIRIIRVFTPDIVALHYAQLISEKVIVDIKLIEDLCSNIFLILQDRQHEVFCFHHWALERLGFEDGYTNHLLRLTGQGQAVDIRNILSCFVFYSKFYFLP